MLKRFIIGILIANALLWLLVWGIQPAANGGGNPFGPLLLATVAIAAYFAPSLIADGRKHKSVGGIAVVNFFLGWTVLGWIVALAWAYADDGRQQQLAKTSP